MAILTVGGIDLTDHSIYVFLLDGASHLRPQNIQTATDWATGGRYVVSYQENGHDFSGELIVFGKSAAHPSRTLTDAQTDMLAVRNAIVQGIKYYATGGQQGTLCQIVEQFGDATSSDTYTVVSGNVEEPTRSGYAGGYYRCRVTMGANLV